MKRLCVFYKKAHKWLGRSVEWIVCKDCQRKLNKGERLQVGWSIGCIPPPQTSRKWNVNDSYPFIP